MGSIFDKLTRKSHSSAEKAKERLHLVLIHDRTDLNPRDLEAMKDKLIAVISEYVAIDADDTEIVIDTDGREQRLVANIPLKTPRKRR
jgi:cell division topological specificity factor